MHLIMSTDLGPVHVTAEDDQTIHCWTERDAPLTVNRCPYVVSVRLTVREDGTFLRANRRSYHAIRRADKDYGEDDPSRSAYDKIMATLERCAGQYLATYPDARDRAGQAMLRSAAERRREKAVDLERQASQLRVEADQLAAAAETPPSQLRATAAETRTRARAVADAEAELLDDESLSGEIKEVTNALARMRWRWEEDDRLALAWLDEQAALAGREEALQAEQRRRWDARWEQEQAAPARVSRFRSGVAS